MKTKHPKRLNFSRPQMWWSPRYVAGNGIVRIFMPDGSSCWMPSISYVFESPSCYALGSDSLQTTYRRMLSYDRACGYRPAEFLGYL